MNIRNSQFSNNTISNNISFIIDINEEENNITKTVKNNLLQNKQTLHLKINCIFNTTLIFLHQIKISFFWEYQIMLKIIAKVKLTDPQIAKLNNNNNTDLVKEVVQF